MKKTMIASIVTTLMSSAVMASTNWINPPVDNCGATDGKGSCSANWVDATAICKSVGARLPTIDELRAEVQNCGGVLNDFEKNIRNDGYQSCFQTAGFRLSGSYWSGTEESAGSSKAWYVGFHLGNHRAGVKRSVTAVRCVSQ